MRPPASPAAMPASHMDHHAAAASIACVCNIACVNIEDTWVLDKVASLDMPERVVRGVSGASLAMLRGCMCLVRASFSLLRHGISRVFFQLGLYAAGASASALQHL